MQSPGASVPWNWPLLGLVALLFEGYPADEA
jgi:hypothetical protein